MNRKLNAKELFHFCEQLSLILRSGISCMEGLHIMMEDSDSSETHEILSSICRRFEETGSLSDTLKESGLFPTSMTAYVRVGEETGCLDEIMTSLAEHYQQEMEITEHIRHAVTYPLMMLGMMGAVILILLVKVLPVFQQVFRQMGMEMNEFSTGLLKIGSAISRYAGVFLILLAILIVFCLFLGCHPVGRKMLFSMVSQIPYLREIPISMDYGRMTQGISLGLRSGLGPELSLELSEALISHPLVLERLQNTRKLLSEGNTFCDSLTQSHLFHGMDARLISIGFQAGAADEVMTKLASRYRDNSVSVLGHILSVIEPTIVIFLSIMVGIVLLSVMMPMLGILSDMII